ncbi:MAG: beta-propeller fold lactonase family protein, partial [Candidatus Bipolaricaulota bacterium]|nr:beta-propeller fold lactonase family protein [Candidatus Bipolaricaulota bacterium]
MFLKVLAVMGLAVLLSVVSFSPGALTQEQEKLVPSTKVDLGGSKVNGFVFTADGKFVFASVSVGRESSVFLVAASTADTKKFYGRRIRGCPITGEICLVQIRGNINPQDLEYNEAKQVLFVPGYDDDTLYISQVVFRDGNPTEARAAKKVAVGAGPRAVAVNAEGTRAFTVNEREHTVSVVDILYKDGAPDKGEVVATIKLDPDEENPTYPSPADILLYGDKAYVVNTDTWKACEIKNVNADSEKVKKGEEKIELGACVDTGAYPRAMAVLGNKGYVVNASGDSVSPLLLDPLGPVMKDDRPVEITVGDAPRGIATDGKCWLAVTNTNVDNVEGAGASLTFIHESLNQTLTVPVTTMVEGDPITPTQIQMLTVADAKFAWVLNISARGKHLYNITEQWFKKNGVHYHHIELVGSHDKIAAVKA